jgi:Spy/CpxP family protein refolding chaperone
MKNYMKKTGRFVMVLTMLIAISLPAVRAQYGQGMGGGNATPEERAKRQTERMKEQLSLTAAQEPKVSAINLKYAKKMEDVRKMTDTAAQRKSVMNLNKQKEAEFKAVLTPEQMKIYQKMVEEMMARRRQMQH